MDETRVTTQHRQLVRARAREHCEYCASPARFASHTFEVDHILPRSLSGDSTPANLAYACWGCNGFKARRTEAKDPQTGELVPSTTPDSTNGASISSGAMILPMSKASLRRGERQSPPFN